MTTSARQPTHSKLNRADAQDKEPKKRAHELDSAAPQQAPAADMPPLGDSGAGLAPTVGAQADAAAADPAVVQAQQQELARLKALPPGDPELESYKKPEAMAAQVPEGPGATGAAAGAAEAMSPKQEQQAPGEIGAPAETVDAAMPDVGAALQKVDVAATVQGGSEAQSGAADAAALRSQTVATPTEQAPEKAAPPSGAEVAPEATVDLDVSAPAELKVEAPSSVELDASAPAAAAASAPQSTTTPTADVEAEARAAAAPKPAPEAKPEAISASAPAAPAAPAEATIAAPKLEASGSAPQIAVDTASEAPAAAATIEAPQGAVTEAPTTQVATEAAIDVQPQAEAAPGVGTAQVSAAPTLDAAAAVATASPDAQPKIEAPDAAPAAASVEQVAGDTSARAAAPAGAEPAAAAIVAPSEPASVEQPAEALPAGAAPAAPQIGAPSLGDAKVEADGGAAAPAALDVAGAAAALTQQGAEGALPGIAADAADKLAGRLAATDSGSPLFGLTAELADIEAAIPPPGRDTGSVDAIEQAGQIAKFDPVKELGDAGLGEAMDRAGQIAQQSGVDARGIAQVASDLEEHVGDLQKRGKQLADLRANPGERVEALLGEGETLDGGLRQKAEKALNTQLGGVKLHRDPGAREIAGAVDAAAFTRGEDIVLGEADAWTDGARDQVIYEELVHVVQQRDGGPGGRSGVSAPTDRAEKVAKTAAQRIADGGLVEGLEADRERRAIHRNEGGSGSQEAGPTFPEKVVVSLGGRTVTVNMPKAPVERNKLVNLPSLNVPGLTINPNATFFFDSGTGAFKGGKTSGSLKLGTVLSSDSRDIQISQSGQMTATFQDASLKVGDLIDARIDASVGPSGVTAHGTLGVADLRGERLAEWLKGGQLTVDVDSQGNAKGSGSLDIEVAPFSPGKLAARLDGQQLAGSVSIQQSADIALGDTARLQAGALTGTLEASTQLKIQGDLALSVSALANGEGLASITWDGDSKQIAGEAVFESNGQNRLEPVVFEKAGLSGNIADTKLLRLEGNGQAVYDDVFAGSFAGGIDLQARKVDMTLSGGLKQPIDRSPVKVWDGQLTVNVQASALASTAGKVEFQLADFMRGTAVLEQGTTKENINATATAALMAAHSFDEITLSKGAATVQVRGTDVKITGGHVDMDFRAGTAVGKLDLAPTSPWEQLTGSGKAALKPGLVFGEIKVEKGEIHADVQQKRLVSAQGQMKFGMRDQFAGNLSFDARENFATIDGTAAAWLTKGEDIGQGVSLVADEATKFTLEVKDAAFDTFHGPLKWEHERFQGTVNVAAPTTALNLITGTGPADVKAPFPIGQAPGGELTGQPGSTLTGHFDAGLFRGVSGSLNWKYQEWLGGKANLAEPVATVGVDQLSGELAAQILAEKPLDNGSEITLLPGAEGSLTVTLQDGRPHQYRGTVDFRFAGFAEGKATVSGEMLDFNQLEGASTLKVVAEKALTGQSGMTLREGGGLAVTVENSTIVDFTGPTNFRYGTWLEGSVTAEAGSRFFDGISGKATGTLKGTPDIATGDLKLQEGGTAKVDLVVGTQPLAYEAGSQLNWKLQDWLGGTIDIGQRTAFASISGTANGGVLVEKALDGNPGITLLPSQGLQVTFANNTPTTFAGSTAARVQEFVEGTLTIEGASSASSFNGKLVGGLKGPFDATDQLRLVEGGAVTVSVLANQAQDIQGTIPFQYGQGDKWLGGLVEAGGSQQFRSIQGPVTSGTVIAGKELGGHFSLKEGGSITATMANSNIGAIGGSINWEVASGGASWLGGKLDLEGEQSPEMFSGQMTAKMLAEKPIGANLVLEKGGAITGQMTRNEPVTFAGTFQWRYGDWLAGSLEVPSPVPLTTVAGAAKSTLKKEHHVQGNVYLRAGGSFDAQIEGGDVTKLSGRIPWRLGDWIQGEAEVTDGTPDRIVGSGPGTITGAGKIYSEGSPSQVKLLAGGSLDVALDAAGEVTYSGPVNAELGMPGATASLHVGRGGEAQAVKGTTFKGTVQGGMLSATKVPAKLALRQGGNITADIDGDIRGLRGTFEYGYGGDAEFLVGQLTVDGATNLNEVSGAITGTISKEQTRDQLTIVKGGSVHGQLISPNAIQLEGGSFGYKYSDYLKGNIEIEGSLDFSSDAGPDFTGGATGKLTRKLDVGAGFALSAGSAAQVHFQNNVADKAWGRLGFTWQDKIQGNIDVAQGDSNFQNVSGEAQATLQKQIDLGKLQLLAPSAIHATFAQNAPTQMDGNVGFKFDDELMGAISLQPGSTLDQVSGEAQGALTARHPVPGTSFALEPGGTIGGVVQNNEVGDLHGSVNWSYGDLGWLKGSVELSSGDLDSVRGRVTGKVAIERFLDENLRIKEGGSFQADFDGAQLAGFQGQVSIVYGGWIDGAAQLQGGSIESIDGEVTATTQTRKEMGSKAFLKPGGSVTATFAGSAFQSFTGDLGWQYEQWLEGAIHVESGSTLESVSGEGSATLRERKPLGEKMALERGGSLRTRFEGSDFKGVAGNVTVLYEDWLGGSLEVPDFSHLESVNGSISANLRQEKQVGAHLTLKQGGNVQAEIQNSTLDTVAGDLGWRWDEWLAGTVHLEPSKLDSLKGHAEAGIVQHKKVGSDLELQPGSGLLIELDAGADIAGQTVMGDLAWKWQDWLGGRVTLGAGSSFQGMQGVAEARLLQDKPAGDALVLKSGGNLRTQLASSAPTTFGGEIDWQYQDWIAGRVTVLDGSTLTAINGEATAHLRAEKPIGDGGFKLKSGGSPTVVFENSAPTSFHGHLNYGYQDWLEGTVAVEPGSTLQAVTARGDANVMIDKALGDKGFRIRAGSRAAVEVHANTFGGLTGEVKWGYQEWLEGAIAVQASDLTTISGEASAQVVAEKPLGGDFTLEPGGNAQVSVQNGGIDSFSGTVKVRYQDLLRGSLTLQGASSLDSVQGEVEGRLLRDWDIGQDVKLLGGGGVKAQFSSAGVDSISGRARFRYAEWLDGVIDIDPGSKVGSIGGRVTAMLAQDKQVGSSGLTLKQGGSLTATFAGSQFQDLAGQANWAYEGGQAKLDGSIRLRPSTLDSISGDAIAHLSAPMDVGNGLQLLTGGDLRLQVENSQPGTFGGRVNWQLESWLQGSVELASGSGFDGPYRGAAEARLLENKQVGSKVELRAGGGLQFEFDSAKNMADSRFNGRVALDYDQWLRGTLALENTTFTSLTGSAKMQLLQDKALGSSGISLLNGSNAEIALANNELTGVQGLVRWRFEDWLEGIIDVSPGSTPDSISGKAHGAITQPKQWGQLRIDPGSGVSVDVNANEIGAFRGTVLWNYDNWLAGSLDLDERTTKDSFYGQGSASVQADKQFGSKVTLKQGGGGLVQIQASEVKTIGGTLQIAYEDWITGQVAIQGQSSLDSLNGSGQIVLTQDKQIGRATLKQGSGMAANFVASDLEDFHGVAKVELLETYGGSIEVEAGSGVDTVRGHVQVGLLKDKPVANKVVLKQGGNLHASFDGTDITQVGGQLAIEYDGWLRGSGDVETGASLDQFVGVAKLEVVQSKTFQGGIELGQGSFLRVDFDQSGPTRFAGNVDVLYDEWLEGNLNFEATSLDSISGAGSLTVLRDKQLVDPLTIQQGSWLKVRVEQSQLDSFGGVANLQIAGWGQGRIAITEGSKTDDISGEAQFDLNVRKDIGSKFTLTGGSLGAQVQHNELKKVWGEARGEVKDLGEGWVRIERSSTLEEFTGQAGVRLTKAQKIGSFAQLTGGEVLANFVQNNLTTFGGWAEIEVFGWGTGRVEIDPSSTADNLSGQAKIALTQRKELAGGKLIVTHGEASATVRDNKLTQLGGKIGIELKDIARGQIQGTLDVEREEFTGGGSVEQIKEWGVGPAKIRDGRLEANVVKNKLASAAGSARIDAGKFGQGTIQVNFIDRGDAEPTIYGRATLEFQPHERIRGRLDAQITEDKKFIGEGSVRVKISPQIEGEAGVALREDGHVVLKGAVRIPGPFELFKADPYKKDMTLLDSSFLVYTPPMVKVNVGAGLGLEAGIKPLTISNIVLSGECDLMEPSFASLAVTGHLSTAAYADLNAWIEGSVSVSAAVVAVQAGLRAALNLHLEAALSADPTITVNRNGLSFDMPVRADLTAALNLILTFFAKVRVGIDVGLFSIMKTVWRYEVSPDPLRLASMSIGAQGHVHAGADGFRATMNPQYQPPDMSIDGLKRALKI